MVMRAGAARVHQHHDSLLPPERPAGRRLRPERARDAGPSGASSGAGCGLAVGVGGRAAGAAWRQRGRLARGPCRLAPPHSRPRPARPPRPAKPGPGPMATRRPHAASRSAAPLASCSGRRFPIGPPSQAWPRAAAVPAGRLLPATRRLFITAAPSHRTGRPGDRAGPAAVSSVASRACRPRCSSPPRGKGARGVRGPPHARPAPPPRRTSPPAGEGRAGGGGIRSRRVWGGEGG
jgi:hypothetical protein